MSESLLTSTLLLAGILVFVLQLPLCVECIAALRRSRSSQPPAKSRPRALILMPAHNEAAILGQTLSRLKHQLRHADAIWVVADNCTDDTAEIAREHGASVLERTNTQERGKGFALQYLIDHLRATTSRENSIAIVLDADCSTDAISIDTIVTEAAALGRPVQARYEMSRPSESAKAQISNFALLVKNVVRQRGLHQLGLPVVLSGSGMAFPWPVLEQVSLANDNTADDLQLTCDLALTDIGVAYCDQATVQGAMPIENDAANIQRTRWIHGHLKTTAEYLPRLIARGLTRAKLTPLIIAAEIAVPPLSILVLLHMLLWGGSVVVCATVMDWWPLLIPTCATLALGSALLVAWFTFGRQVVSLAAIASLPGHVIRSIVSSASLPFRRQHWTPTTREVAATPAEGASS